MLKKYLVVIILIFIVLQINNKNFVIPHPTDTSTSAPEESMEEKFLDINFNTKNYSFAWFKIHSISSLQLLPNFDRQQIFSEVVKENKCNLAINAGFYDTKNNPIGLFIFNGRTLSSFQTNSLFNGIFSITFDDKPQISESYLKGSTRIALQTGPILIREHLLQKLAIKNDESRRRSLVAINSDNEVYFATVFDKTSNFSGPRLSDMPEVAQKIAEKLDTNFQSAINLDGGTASAFYRGDENIILSEASPVGGIFCGK